MTEMSGRRLARTRQKTAIMQPYFMPYVGYFQLIASVDLFVVYDNIQYSKGGWINRNRLLRDGEPAWFSLPLKSDSDYLDIHDRELAPSFSRDKLLNQIASAYRRAPHFAETFPLIDRIVRFEDTNLFRYVEQSIAKTCEHLGITTEIRRSSEIAIDHGQKGQTKVIALCEALGATTYVNAIGGTELYSRDEFQSRGIELKFLKPTLFEYTQFGAEFVPWLSIVDVLMFNPIEDVQTSALTHYQLV
jgi:WbqC-like protein family